MYGYAEGVGPARSEYNNERCASPLRLSSESSTSFRESPCVKSIPISVSTMGKLLLVGAVGGVLGRMSAPETKVQAQESFSGITNCITAVPKTWGEFKGGSTYGLAFEDDKGVVRFVLHPSCSSLNSPTEPPPAPIDLEIQRR